MDREANPSEEGARRNAAFTAVFASEFTATFSAVFTAEFAAVFAAVFAAPIASIVAILATQIDRAANDSPGNSGWSATCGDGVSHTKPEEFDQLFRRNSTT